MVNAFYSSGTDEELVAKFRAEGGRSAIRRRIIAEVGSTQVHLSEMGGYAPISSFINHLDVQGFESRALIARQKANS